ncbi:MAG: hypothetical protein PHH52_02095 [Patescibacteria group bacterium]|nr:hypothetical protein [Patescibacteria group bacterium]MDD3778153.1 hypothetical protein [Patescibacteria group bacterium]MDD3939078.1 hypothetical protein [Patescibacteria group bacterium]MDD4443619.1 hypothetical protein [Patescibacteria group bacterium]NCU39311.1 hypothetical protein [Candidatus Falkowbacteria bacterium]
MTSDKKKNKNFTIENRDSSSLSAFIKRPVPTHSEVSDFEDVIEKEVRHQEIDANLSEIYKDKKGGLIDVKKMKIKKKNAWFIRLFKKALLLAIILVLANLIYAFFFSGDSNVEAVRLEIKAPEQVMAGEEFSYIIIYENPTKYPISKIKLELNYPDNFIFSNSSVEPNNFNNSFNLPSLQAGEEAQLVVKGNLIGKIDSVNVISSTLRYVPGNFSSEFKKEGSAATVIQGFGFDVNLDYPDLVFIGQTSDVTLSFSPQEKVGYLSEAILEFSPTQGAEISLKEEGDYGDAIIKQGENIYLINLPILGDKKIEFKYKVNSDEGSVGLPLILKQKIADTSYIFYSKILEIEAVKSDLNLSLFLNGEKADQAVSFGDTLNYTLNYANRGESAYKNAVITAVLDGELFDLSSLNLSVPGDIRSNQIIWNEQDIAGLQEIKPGDEGEISFSVKIKEYSTTSSLSNAQVSVYSQYGADANSDKEQRSNIIISPLNSNLKLTEEIRYFDVNNMPVGTGPLPPEVGSISSFRVYWKLANNLHELRETKISLVLPDYINYVKTDSVAVGDLYFDDSSREVVWDLGRLPASVSLTDASFTISLAPQESDRDKILVISSGAKVSAIDTITREKIESKAGPKTTKLEDDDIAALTNSGRIK